MLLGKISALLLGMGIGTAILLEIIEPKWSSPLVVLGVPFVVCCIFASLVVGAVGIGVDKKKILAIAVTCVVSALVAFIFLYPWVRRIMS